MLKNQFHTGQYHTVWHCGRLKAPLLPKKPFSLVHTPTPTA